DLSSQGSGVQGHAQVRGEAWRRWLLVSRFTGCTVMLLCAARLWAGYGIVESVDGEKFAGEVRLESGGVVVTSTNETASRVELAKLALLRFHTAPVPQVSSPTGVVHG